MATLKDIFAPERDVCIQQLKHLVDLHEHQLGQCSTCGNYIPPDRETPGFFEVISGNIIVEDYGDCAKKSPLFDLRIIGSTTADCSFYFEDPIFRELIGRYLKELGDKNAR